jgi:hypothetical protein
MTEKSIPTPVREILAAKGAFEAANVAGANVPTTIPTMGKAVCSWLCGKLSSFWGWCFCASSVAIYVLGAVVFMVVGTVVLQIASRMA